MSKAMALSIAIEDKRQRIFLLMEAIGLAGLLLFERHPGARRIWQR